MRHIGGFQRFDFLVGKFDVQSGDGFFDVPDGRRADDRRGNIRFRQHPSQSVLRHRVAVFLRHVFQCLDDFFVLRFGSAQTIGETASIFDRSVRVPQGRAQHPPARGDHGTTAIFLSRYKGIISRSSSR